MENQSEPRSVDEAKQRLRQSWQDAVNNPLSVVRDNTRRFPLVSVAAAGAAGVVAERAIPALFRTLKTTLKTHPEWLLFLAQQLISTRKK
jgi:hypothetical protein